MYREESKVNQGFAADKSFKTSLKDQDYLETLQKLVRDGHETSIVITGNSMSPFLIHKRDKILISPIAADYRLKRGDMVFYQRSSGQYVMHRIYKVLKDGSFDMADRDRTIGDEQGRIEPAYAMVGDGQTQIEQPVYESQIFGIITKVCRKGKWIGNKSFWWKFFQYIWIRMVPMRGICRRCYEKAVGKFKSHKNPG